MLNKGKTKETRLTSRGQNRRRELTSAIAQSRPAQKKNLGVRNGPDEEEGRGHGKKVRPKTREGILGEVSEHAHAQASSASQSDDRKGDRGASLASSGTCLPFWAQRFLQRPSRRTTPSSVRGLSTLFS